MSQSTTATIPTTTTTTTTAASVVVPPSLQVVVRSKGAAFLESSPKYAKNEALPVNASAENNCKHVEYSRDGSLIAFVNANNIVVYKTTSGEVASIIERAGISCISFSPLNSFMVTYERLQKETNNNENNLIVWDLATRAPVFRSTQKYFEQENWPLIKWSDDEILAGRLMKNEIHFFNGRSIGLTAKKLRLQDVQAFYFAPGEPYKICTFVPEQKSVPGSARIYQYPAVNEHIAHVSFFKCNEARVLWNKKGDGVLVYTFTYTDKSGKSYYGETDLWYLGVDGSSFNVPVSGPIHDVQWSPTFDQFVVVHGNMPSHVQTTLYNTKGNPLVDFGLNPRNTVRFSPNGKILCIGGFGNLQGDMDFWDLTRYKKISSTNCYCASYHEWAADSIHFCAAVLSPRIRVDNGFKIIKYDGSVVYKESISELYQVIWKPQSPFLFPDEKIVFQNTVATSSKYVPPSQRAASAATSSPSASTTSSPLPPGFKIYLTSAPVNQPQKKQSPKLNSTTTTTSPTTNSNNNSKATTTTTTSSGTSSTDNESKEKKELTPLDKKIRSLERKLKEVDVLKAKMSQNEKLPPTAIEKICNEGKFREELNQLYIERNNQN